MEILLDVSGARLTNLQTLVTNRPISDEQAAMPMSEESVAVIAMIESDIVQTNYVAAKEWRDALMEYFAMRINEYGDTVAQAVARAIDVYGQDEEMEAYLAFYLSQQFGW